MGRYECIGFQMISAISSELVTMRGGGGLLSFFVAVVQQNDDRENAKDTRGRLWLQC